MVEKLERGLLKKGWEVSSPSLADNALLEQKETRRKGLLSGLKSGRGRERETLSNKNETHCGRC